MGKRRRGKQIILCPKCGRQLTGAVCIICNNKKLFEERDKDDNKDEKDKDWDEDEDEDEEDEEED